MYEWFVLGPVHGGEEESGALCDGYFRPWHGGCGIRWIAPQPSQPLQNLWVVSTVASCLVLECSPKEVSQVRLRVGGAVPLPWMFFLLVSVSKKI